MAFEGRRYSVPFRWVGQTVEVRGCAGRVQVVAEAAIVAQHERHVLNVKGRSYWLRELEQAALNRS